MKNISGAGDKPYNETTSSVKNRSTSGCVNNLDDNFSSPYYLDEGQTSPYGKWENVYSGYGATGVESADKNLVFFLKPSISKSTDETEAAFVKSTGSFCNYVLDIDVKTVKQLRQNNPPNDWEAAWIFFRYTDTFHYYWFLLLKDGFELGKKDCDDCKDSYYGQQPLVTGHNISMQLDTWSHWKIIAVGNHIQVYVNGKLIVDYIDDKMNPKQVSGNIGMYSEDANVQYDNIHLKSK